MKSGKHMQSITLTPKVKLEVMAHCHLEVSKKDIDTDPDLLPYETLEEPWTLEKGMALPCILLVDGPLCITVFDPEEKAVIFGIPKCQVAIR